MWQAAFCIVVGLMWGCTNPLVKRGSEQVQQKQDKLSNPHALSSLLLHLTTPSFIIPQLVNLSGSVLFATQLGGAVLSVVVPLTNGIALAANAVMDVLMGSKYQLQYLLPGLILVTLGFILCTQ